MTFEFAHNFIRKLMNLEWDQLPFLNDKQKDGFFANPHTFFIRADDETARQIWDVLYPKPKEPAAGEAAKDAGGAKVVDLDAYRRVIDAMRPLGPPIRSLEYRYKPVTDYEYDTGRVYPLPRLDTAADVPGRYVNSPNGPFSAVAVN
jgi:hypothetical protein